MLNIAIWLTLSRFLLLPLTILPLALGWSNGGFIAACITQLAGLTDFADGIVARRTGHTTPLGTNLDFFSDKLFIGGMLVALASLRLISAWIPAVVLAREVAVSVARFHHFHWRPPSPDMWGKAKTMVSYGAIMWVALRSDLTTNGIVAWVNSRIILNSLLSLAPWVMYAAVALTIISGLNYIWQFTIKHPGVTKS